MNPMLVPTGAESTLLRIDACVEGPDESDKLCGSTPTEQDLRGRFPVH